MNERHDSIPLLGRLTILLGLMACMLVYCCGCVQTDPTPSSAIKASSPRIEPPVVQVSGDRADFNLGTVKPVSRHKVIFAIHNDSDKPLKIARIKGDCACIASAEAPEFIAPGKISRVVAIFDAPDINAPYGSELIILTDDPLRKIIRLGVRANIQR